MCVGCKCERMQLSVLVCVHVCACEYMKCLCVFSCVSIWSIYEYVSVQEFVCKCLCVDDECVCGQECLCVSTCMCTHSSSVSVVIVQTTVLISTGQSEALHPPKHGKKLVHSIMWEDLMGPPKRNNWTSESKTKDWHKWIGCSKTKE